MTAADIHPPVTVKLQAMASCSDVAVTNDVGPDTEFQHSRSMALESCRTCPIHKAQPVNASAATECGHNALHGAVSI